MHVISKRKGIRGVSIILLAIVLCGCSSSQEKWSLELLEEVPYKEIFSEFIGNTSIPNFITDTEISFFAYGTQCILDLNTLHFESFGRRGKGPGEFEGAWGQSMITIGDRKYCIDQSKMSMMIFNAQNEFLKEIKLDYMPCSIFKLPDDKLGIIQYPSGSDKKLVSVYSPEGEFIEKIVPVPKSLYGYEGPLNVDFRYRMSPFCFQRGDYIYISSLKASL